MEENTSNSKKQRLLLRSSGTPRDRKSSKERTFGNVYKKRGKVSTTPVAANQENVRGIISIAEGEVINAPVVKCVIGTVTEKHSLFSGRETQKEALVYGKKWINGRFNDHSDERIVLANLESEIHRVSTMEKRLGKNVEIPCSSNFGNVSTGGKHEGVQEKRFQKETVPNMDRDANYVAMTCFKRSKSDCKLMDGMDRCDSNHDNHGEEQGVVAMENNTDFCVERPQLHNASLLSDVSVGYSNKKLLILDINGLLVDIVDHIKDGYKPDIIVSRKSAFKRPYCDDFLKFCFENFNVGIWSSRVKRNVDTVMDFLLEDSRDKLLFCWDQSHCTETGLPTPENRSKPLVLKELRKLWKFLNSTLQSNMVEYNESNTLLLDDSPHKALRNPVHTAIFPLPYKYTDEGDSSLGPSGDLWVYLEGLAMAPNVQEYIAQNPFGQRPISESNPSWDFYKNIISSDS